MRIKRLVMLEPCKENNFAKIDKGIPKKPGVYLLYDGKGTLLYIGKASNIRQRILQHVSAGNSSRYQVGDNLNFGCSSMLPLGCVSFFSYILVDQEEQRSTTEMILIHLLKPYFNFGDIEEKTKSYLKDFKSE